MRKLCPSPGLLTALSSRPSRLPAWFAPLALAVATTAAAQPQPADAIGIVLTAKGQVEARDARGATRSLQRGANIFAADTILVGPEAYAQVRMVDDATFSLKSDTAFTFDTYDYDGNPATPDSAAMSMLRGGFRTISGSIGDADADSYSITTPYASIGIRGTMHSAVIFEGTLFTGVYEGGTTISNSLGSIDAGIGANFDYTETFAGLPPHGLVEAPPILGLIDLAAALAQAAVPDVAADTGVATTNDNAAPGPDFAALAAPANTSQDGNAEMRGPTTATQANATTPSATTTSASAAPANQLAAVTTNVTGRNPQTEVNPVLFSRAAEELDDSPVRGNAGGNGGPPGNGGAGGNDGNPGNNNAGGNNGNSGNNNAGGNNGNSGNNNAGGNNGNSGNNNAGENNANSGNNNAGGNNGNSGNNNAGGNNGNSSNNNAGGNNGNSGNNNAGGNNGNSGNNNAGGNNGNSGNNNAGGNNGNSGNNNAGGNNGNSGNNNAGGNNGNSGNNNAGGNNGNSGNNNAGGNNGNSGNNNAGGNNVNSGNNNAGGNNGNSGNNNAGGNNGNSGNNNAGGNNGNSGNNNAGGNNGNSGNNNAGGNNGNSGNGNNGNSGNGNNGNSPRGLAARSYGFANDDFTPTTSFVLDWGVWDSALPVAQNSIRAIIGRFFEGNAEHAILVPANLADLSGSVNYASSGKFAGVDATGGALRNVDMHFDVDLAGGPGAITNGRLDVLDSRQHAWNATFDGDVANASATMTNVIGTHGDHPITGSIQGVFSGTGVRPDFVSGFVLQSQAGFVQGITELHGEE